MIKKSLVFLIFGMFCVSFVVAQDYSLEVSTLKTSFQQGEKISLKVTIYDSEGKLVNDNVNVVLQDAEKTSRVEEEIHSNTFQEIDIGQDASYGQGEIITTYKDSTARGTFIIEIQEIAKFEIKDENLIITNIGNTKYTKSVQIAIGETTGVKQPKLNPGKSVSYKLVAPEGVYNIKVTDGKTTLTQGDIRLTGTGQVIGALDQTAGSRSPITGRIGISPGESSDEALLGYIKKSKFVYTFFLVVFGAMILLAVERRYSKKASA